MPTLVGEFASAHELLDAVARLRARGYTLLEAFTPHPVHGLEEALRLGRSSLDWLVFALALGGAGAAFAVQWYCNAVAYPLEVGGRPPFAVPAFVPITFEGAVLLGALAAFIGLFAVCGLPRLAHPVFDLDGFERATLDRFFLAVGEGDPRFDVRATADEMARAGALRVQTLGGMGR